MNYYFKGTHKNNGSIIYFNRFSKMSREYTLLSVKEDYFIFEVEQITKEEYWKMKYINS